MLLGNRGTVASTSRPCSDIPRHLHLEPLSADSIRRKSCRASSRKAQRVVPQAAIVESETSQPAQAATLQENRIPASNILVQSPPEIRLAGQDVEDAALKACVQHHLEFPHGLQIQNFHDSSALTEAYKKCGAITKMYAKTFYLGTQLMTPEKARAIWAIYVWCRRTDELVDGPQASRITPMALDRWQERLEATFEGKPYDILDAALTETVSRFPVAIQPFYDMIEGMRMDLVKPRYQTFDELYEYCYRVAGTVGLMSTPVMGIDPSYKGDLEPVYKAALALGTANQLTNILRDVGEDAVERDRIYVPLDDLRQFGISEREVTEGLMFAAHNGQIDDRWQAFMRFQITRARQYFADAEAGVGDLDRNARWPVWSALILYRQILDGIEANGFNNFTKRAYVPKWRKLVSLPAAFARANMPAMRNQASQQLLTRQ